VIFKETLIKNLYIVEPEYVEDNRGFFARTWCAVEFKAHGLKSRVVQCNLSSNRRRGTLRGIHYQIAPRQEAKLVSCTRGAVYDVVVDLREHSSTFGEWVAFELTGDNHKMLYIPEGCGHGFQTLCDDTEVFYQMSEFYSPECARGVRWNDPGFRIAWPKIIEVISDRDSSYPDFKM
jgi:dTDP-4-dehydrorhamnose 3,5-epimerase